MKKFRRESDAMGNVKVPADALYGAQTQRALENFQISNLRFQKRFICALCMIKLAAAKVNLRLKLLDKKRGDAIVAAAEEAVKGKFDDQFVIDVFQTGSGTSTNMNANEIVANRANLMLGGDIGYRSVHPNDHVNMGQSTNDVFPAAINLVALQAVKEELIPSLKTLETSLRKKAREFDNIVKAGRTHLQDAVPMTLGQEFGGYASVIGHNIRRIENCIPHLSELPIGGTAVGTGLNAHPKFAALVIEELRQISKMEVRRAENLFEAMQNKDTAVELSGALNVIAVGLMKIANDLRLLYSGPRTGFDEIELPAIQPGSSIMPAKVNPVIPEAVSMVAAKVMGNNLTITIASQSGNLELNTMMPVIAYTLLESLELISAAAKTFSKRCIDGIKANRTKTQRHADDTIAMITVVAPLIGYDRAARIAKKAMKSGKSIKDIIIDEGILPKEKANSILNPKKLAKGGSLSN
ncbi:MAG: class II fumarate hydratase [Thaumarchaeota archaeon]|nr:class II fumarate hydratase [Nitrososphaerota archaeon]